MLEPIHMHSWKRLTRKLSNFPLHIWKFFCLPFHMKFVLRLSKFNLDLLECHKMVKLVNALVRNYSFIMITCSFFLSSQRTIVDVISRTLSSLPIINLRTQPNWSFKIKLLCRQIPFHILTLDNNDGISMKSYTSYMFLFSITFYIYIIYWTVQQNEKKS